MIDLATIREAHQRIKPLIRRTPVVRCAEIDALLEAEVYLKCENLQAAGAFKTRGACNTVFSLADDRAGRGVATHSSGNHAAALARAALLRGTTAFIVMPHTARPAKVANVRKYHGQITFCEPTLADRERTAARVVEQTGATLVHPYDDWRIIAGQGTAAVELLEDVPDLDCIVVPVGGGGLLAGTALTAKGLRPATAVWGAEPAGADDAYRSWRADQLIPSREPNTIADGLLTSLGQRNFEVIRQLVDAIVLAGEQAIVDAVLCLHQHARLTVEPSAAVPLAALLEHDARPRGRRIGIILSGGNAAISELPIDRTQRGPSTP